MSFTSGTYPNLVAEGTQSRERLFRTYDGPRDDFDIVIIGSGIGGGVLADDLAERLGPFRRILVLEAGSFLYPTHIYNVCRFPNSRVAQHFGCDTFWQSGDSNTQNYIGEKLQLNFGGRSIFWSGLIPMIQGWELDFFPPRVRRDLEAGLLNLAGETMNESRTMGSTAQGIVAKLRQSPLAQHFSIQETPRALHQPYLTRSGMPKDEFFTEPTGVFNTAELLLNQLGLTPGVNADDGPGLHLRLNNYVEDIQSRDGRYEVLARNTLDGSVRTFRAVTVVLAAGSIESPKLLRRSSLYPWLPDAAKQFLGRGLTDHPTSNEITTHVTHIGNLAIGRNCNAKIIFYSRGLRDSQNRILFPFNVEMNINHEYWHLRDNDPASAGATAAPTEDPLGPSRLDIKFSFGNCLDDGNEVKVPPPFGYVPEIAFRNLRWMDHLAGSRFPALANWNKGYDEIWAVLNQVTYEIFSQFRNGGQPARPDGEVWYGQGGKGFGWGTVHHAAGTMRMPYRPSLDAPFNYGSVVDEDLRVAGHPHLYVCDMSVMPVSSAANPVRSLVALALRLSHHFG